MCHEFLEGPRRRKEVSENSCVQLVRVALRHDAVVVVGSLNVLRF